MAETTHKLLAIMFTDIEGYSTLMGMDEGKALQILEKNRQIQKTQIKQFNGTLLKDMGDGTMLSFETATNCVRCAIAIQKLSIENQIPLRIGIHLGEVMVSGRDIWGDGVNIGSRIEKLCKPGSVLISKAVKNEIENKGISTIELGTIKLKNIARLVTVFAIKSNGLNIPNRHFFLKVRIAVQGIFFSLPRWLSYVLSIIILGLVIWYISLIVFLHPQDQLIRIAMLAIMVEVLRGLSGKKFKYFE